VAALTASTTGEDARTLHYPPRNANALHHFRDLGGGPPFAVPFRGQRPASSGSHSPAPHPKDCKPAACGRPQKRKDQYQFRTRCRRMVPNSGAPHIHLCQFRAGLAITRSCLGAITSTLLSRARRPKVQWARSGDTMPRPCISGHARGPASGPATRSVFLPHQKQRRAKMNNGFARPAAFCRQRFDWAGSPRRSCLRFGPTRLRWRAASASSRWNRHRDCVWIAPDREAKFGSSPVDQTDYCRGRGSTPLSDPGRRRFLPPARWSFICANCPLACRRFSSQEHEDSKPKHRHRNRMGPAPWASSRLPTGPGPVNNVMLTRACPSHGH